MNLLITICGRGGSKGLPGKNIKFLNGKPLIYYSISCAKRVAGIYESDIAISTDNKEIKMVAESFGVATDYVRPDKLATDTAGKIPVINHLLEWEESRRGGKYDFIIDLDITSPLRSVEDVIQSLGILVKDNSAYNIFSVSPPNRNPYFNQVEEKMNHYYNVVKKPVRPILSRQTAPLVWDVNASIYIYRRSFFDKDFMNAYTDKSLVYQMSHICFDLDEIIDYEFMEYLIINKKLDFSFDY